MLKNVNIRATALKEFWGEDYDEALYLWDGAKHNLTLGEMEELNFKTSKDVFSTNEAIGSAIARCKEIYFRYLPVLSKQLNKYHGLNLSSEFWQIAFGYWFYRHICIVFDKYENLSKLDIDCTSIKLLDKKSFYTPFDYYDHVTYFGNDWGVQQLVSEYYYHFANKEFGIIEKRSERINKYVVPKTKRNKKDGIKSFLNFKVPYSIKVFLKRLVKPKLVLLDANYAKNLVFNLFIRSRGSIIAIDLPKVDVNTNNINMTSRRTIFDVETNDKFEAYFIGSLLYSMPSIFIENFKNHYNTYLKDIKQSQFSHIVSEGWIGRSNTAIYCALANENQKQFIFQEHAAGHSILDNSNLWIYSSFPNLFLTTGWTFENTNFIKGGFLAKDSRKYKFDNKKSDILFISHAAYPYLVEYSSHCFNSLFLSEIYSMNNLIDSVPSSLLSDFKYRPRKAPHLWDTAYTLGLNEREELIDNGNFSESIINSRIVIIDHISTGIAELLLIDVPFLLMLHPHTGITQEAKSVIDNLFACGVAHRTPESVIKKLNEVYDRVEEWWGTDEIKSSVSEFKSAFIAPPSYTFNFLFSCIKR